MGDNTEGGRAISCEASDLVVPVEGVDRTAIADAIASLSPVGWTPIDRSLERSERDFPASDNRTTNAVVLVTDGLETCDGDPSTEAASLIDGDREITTHVIGFALNPDEQQSLQSITEASGGLLLGANDATELTGALFQILEELEVVQGVGLIGGNALSLVSQGEQGVLAVVAVGIYDGNTLPFVVRNNTGQPVISLSASATAANPAGQLIATGGDQGLNPNLVRPGGLSIGYLYFGGVELPEDTAFELEVDGVPAGEEQFENQRDLEVVEAAYVDGRVVGTLNNGYGETLTGPFSVQLACFDQSGALLDADRSFTQKDSADPGEMVPFQAPSFGSLDCPLFLVAGSGFSNSFDERNKATDILTPEADRGGAAQATVGVSQSASELTDASEVEVSSRVPLATPGASGCFDLATADGVVAALAAANIPIGDRIVYTPADDPNELMGRPGGYTSKVNFRDERLDSEGSNFDTPDGGSVEVFASESDLEARIARLAAVWEATPIIRPDVVFSEGTVLLRVSSRLLTEDSAAYEAALEEAVACS